MPSTQVARWVLAVALLAGGLLRFSVLSSDHGIFWPDELYQSFEPAHALVFGHGLIPWEFFDGARNWALPGLVALVMKLCALLGADQPAQYIGATRALFALLSLGTALGTFRLARAVGADELPASLASTVVALAAPFLYFSHRAMSENASTLPLIWGLALVFDRASSRRLVWLGASCLGLAVMFRLQSAVVCVVVLGVLAAWKQWRALRDVTVVLAIWALLFGALDAFTWHDVPGAKLGGWFHSAVVYLRFNLIEGKAAGWGVAPWYFFGQRLFTSMPALAVLFVLGVLGGLRRAPALVMVALVFFALHSASPHKEYRFILPMIPMLAALVATSTALLPLERLRQAALGALLVSTLYSAATARSLTFGDLGHYPGRERDSAWDDNGPINRLMLVASSKEDVCGLITPAHPAWMGGATYLHRKALIFSQGWPFDCFQTRTCNYAIVPKQAGPTPIAEDTGLMLVKVFDGPCAPVPNYQWRLP